MILTIDYSSNRFLDKIKTMAVRKFFRPFTDPLVFSKVGNYYIKHKFSHNLPKFLINHRYYNINMVKVAETISKKYKDLTIIDVGANIGDSVALIKTFIEVPILSIEGNGEYYELLKENTKKFKNIKLIKTMVDERRHTGRGEITNINGTGLIEVDKTSDTISFDKIDNLLRLNKKYAKSKFIKIDTDGYDGKVIRGSTVYIKKQKPIIFFEYSPILLESAGDSGEEIISFLKDRDYKYLLIYMNTGEFLCSTQTTNTRLLGQLTHYLKDMNMRAYYDICAFTEDDLDIYKEIVLSNTAT
jgi:FkbM family methyltransferase